jgi:hypothetical protein
MHYLGLKKMIKKVDFPTNHSSPRSLKENPRKIYYITILKKAQEETSNEVRATSAR